MLSNGTNLGLLVDGIAGEEHYDAITAQWRGLDALVQPTVKDKDLTAPPGAPADGDCYIVAAAATGAWAGKDNKIARYSSKLTAWEFFTAKQGWRVQVVDEKFQYRWNGTAWVAQVICIPIACGDESTAITTGTKVTFHMWHDFNLKEVMIGLTTPQTSGSLVRADVKEAGASIFSTKPTIDNTEDTSLTAVTLPVLSDTFLAKGSKIEVSVDQIGDGTAKGLKVYLIGDRA